jgi:hypothetical protein
VLLVVGSILGVKWSIWRCSALVWFGFDSSKVWLTCSKAYSLLNHAKPTQNIEATRLVILIIAQSTVERINEDTIHVVGEFYS